MSFRGYQKKGKPALWFSAGIGIEAKPVVQPDKSIVYVKRVKKSALWTTLPAQRKALEAAAARRNAAKEASKAAKRDKVAARRLERLKNRTATRKRIAPVSERRKVERQEYLRKREHFLLMFPACERCGNKATDVHHKAGRGKNYLDATTWAALCSKCHDWVHNNMDAARAAGLLAAKGAWM